MLDEFIKQHEIDKQAVIRMRHRVFVVGRFNQRRSGHDPEVWLFTNRLTEHLSDTYRSNFTGVDELRYESFVQCLQPALTETIQWQAGLPQWVGIAQVRQQVPNASDGVGSKVVDAFNLFFQRAIYSTSQGALRDCIPRRLPLELQDIGGDRAGRSVFRLLQHWLITFSRFQPRTHEIVEAFSLLLGDCARYNALPAYAVGGALPTGLPEKLIDFVYAEDPGGRFRTDGIDFSRVPWDEVQRDKGAEGMFLKVVEAFRDALLGSRRNQFGHLFLMGQTLDDLAGAAVGRHNHLRAEFAAAREAFNGLRQMLCNNCLISTVLNWVLTAYYDIPDVRALGSGAASVDKDAAVENAVLKRWKENQIAQPLAIPSLEERGRFSQELGDNFEQFLHALAGQGETRKEDLEKLPAELRSLAERIKRDHPERVETISVMARLGGATYLERARAILLDLLGQAVFRHPVLSEEALQSFFRSEMNAAFLAAVSFSPVTGDTRNPFGRDWHEFFQAKTDFATGKIRDSADIQQWILADFIDLLTSDEIRRRLVDGLAVLNEAQVILRNSRAPRSASAISALRPDPALRGPNGALQRTEPSSDRIISAIRLIAEKEALEVIRERAGGYQQSPSAPSGAQPLVDSKFEQEIRDKVRHLARQVESAKDVQSSELAENATRELLDDPVFMAHARDAIRAFEQILFLIYDTYNKNLDNTRFTSQIRQLSLINAMSLFSRQAGIGNASSNLCHMLLDLIRFIDGDNPDPKDFIANCSLTRYFDAAQISNGGITNLKQVLESQAFENLRVTADFVSELWGIKYMIEQVKYDRDAEVVVVNATADEFLRWIVNDNLTPSGSGRLRSEFLVHGLSDRSIQPGLIYMTDCSFERNDRYRSAFLRQLAATNLTHGPFRMLLPPICFSTGSVTEDQTWHHDGVRWAEEALGAPGPAIIVGPSAHLNRQNDSFQTRLSAGYLFATHFLSQPMQDITIPNVGNRSVGRFRVIGPGFDAMRGQLERLMWPETTDASSSFAVDYYLHVVLSLLAAAGRRFPVDAEDFYRNFNFPGCDWESSAEIDEAVIGGNALRFSMTLRLIPGMPLPGVDVADQKIGVGTAKKVTDVAWFNLARRRVGIA